METKSVNTIYEFLQVLAPGPAGLVESFVDNWELYPAILQEGIDAVNLDEEYMAEGRMVEDSFIHDLKYNNPSLFKHSLSSIDNYQMSLGLEWQFVSV